MRLNGINEPAKKVIDLSYGAGNKDLELESQNKQAQPMQTPHGATPQQFDGWVTVIPARPGKLLRLPLVEDRTGAKKSSIYAWVKAGTFPAPVRLSARAVGWREEDIDRWVSERVTIGGRA